MKVLITGGAGYIGSVLSRMLLERGHQVTIMDKLFFGKKPIEGIEDRINLIEQDIRWCNPQVFNGIDAVLDLASLSNDPSGELDPQATMSINFEGRQRIARLAKKAGVKRYVLASTCSVYGFRDGICDESTPLNPLTTYSKASALAEDSILLLSDSTFCTTFLRQATVYGLSYRMRFDLAINGMSLGIFKSGKLPLMRDGEQWRPFVHIKDTSTAFIKVIEAETDVVNGQVFNIGSDTQNIQIGKLAKLVIDATAPDTPIEWYGSPDSRSYRVSFKKVRDILGFTAEHSISDGASEVFKSLKDRLIIDTPNTITVKWYKHLIESGVKL